MCFASRPLILSHFAILLECAYHALSTLIIRDRLHILLPIPIFTRIFLLFGFLALP